MHCPFCQNPDTKVIDTRISDDGYSIRRRRVCPKCNKRFTTVETSMLLVTKRSGGAEPFSRDKVISGVRKACQGRPVKEEDLKLLGQKVEEDLRSRGLAEVTSGEVGKAILKPLRDLDVVAYHVLRACIRISPAWKISRAPSMNCANNGSIPEKGPSDDGPSVVLMQFMSMRYQPMTRMRMVPSMLRNASSVAGLGF